MSTRQLIEVLETQNLCPDLKVESLKKLALKNKVLLQFLNVVKTDEPLRVEQEIRLRRTVQAARCLSDNLDGFDYVFFKFVKPVKYTPADIDLLVSLEDSLGVVRKIESLGYFVVVAEPYCTTLVNGESIVDVYVHPTIGGIIYLDGARLLEHVRHVEFNGFKIRTLAPHVEALVAAAHAVYKEKLYTLNDYFVIKKWVTKESFTLAKKLNCEYALKLALSLNQKIDCGQLNMPYSLPVSFWFFVLLQKFCQDKLTSATSLNVLKALKDERSGKHVTSKLTRETY
jgi:hypothetical protein